MISVGNFYVIKDCVGRGGIDKKKYVYNSLLLMDYLLKATVEIHYSHFEKSE